jgi:hypothetical protein
MPSALAGGVAASIQLVGNFGDEARTLGFATELERTLGLDLDLRPVDVQSTTAVPYSKIEKTSGKVAHILDPLIKSHRKTVKYQDSF